MSAVAQGQLFAWHAGGAIFSPQRIYRYRLWRTWRDRSPRCVFVGVNPSVADEFAPDHSVTKSVGFAKRWGFGAVEWVNLFGLVSTDVTMLIHVADPVGPDNDQHVWAALGGAHRVVWAWGKHNARVRKLIAKRAAEMGYFAVPRACETGTLGRNGDGSPRHPLMLPCSTRFVEGAVCP